ncbi:hypothetical protein [Erythrobacter sp.]|uniref:hypothetical protein n=1 Tax=Erythrobacter sp. TaxID=1042 RepID=UPI0025B92433|nr:hypothetical protein [Erythrobacter sp.]
MGENPETYEAFHTGLLASLNPGTPHEAVIAENLVAIEWELRQHRAMRDASIRRTIRSEITRAVVEKAWQEFNKAAAKASARTAHDSDDLWNPTEVFDDTDAKQAACQLVDRITSRDPQVRDAAEAELAQLGMDPLDLMSAATHGALTDGNGADDAPEVHDAKIRELERRRREVKRDYDALVQARADEGVIIDQ